MSSFVLSSDAIKDAATFTTTTAAAGYAASNMQSDNKLETWRSTVVTAQLITATWSTAEIINAVCLAHHNLIIGSVIRIKLYTLAADVSAVYDSGNMTLSYAAPPPAGFSTNNSLSFGFGGGNYFSHIFKSYVAEKLEVTITSAGNTDGFIEVSRLLAGSAFVTNKIEYGAATGHVNMSAQTRSDSGSLVIDRLPQSRVQTLSLANLDNDERVSVSEILRVNGNHTPAFVSIFPAKAEKKAREFEIYGYLEDATIPYISTDNSRIDLKINEV